MSASDAAVKLVQDALDEKNAEIEEKVGSLVTERDELVAFLKKATRGAKAPGGAPATSDDDLLAAVVHCSKEGPAKSTDIAKFLGVDPRTFSRRLSAWGAEGKIAGNKDDGYSAA